MNYKEVMVNYVEFSLVISFRQQSNYFLEWKKSNFKITHWCLSIPERWWSWTILLLDKIINLDFKQYWCDIDDEK